jgi:hypothetical protein
MIQIKVEKKEDRAAYEFFRRYDAQMIASMIYDLNGKTIAEAAKDLGMDITSFMVCIGHLKRVGIVREVRIV